jgi:hypothetical protein
MTDDHGKPAFEQADPKQLLLGYLDAGAELTDVAAVGGRFADGDRRPTLAWVLFHVLQEYARHAGHLDIVRELLDGATGE